MDIKQLALFINNAKKPAVLCSFGKDSLVLLDMARKIKPDIDVISFRLPYFPKKYRFMNYMIEKFNITTYDFPPSYVEYYQMDDVFDAFDMYYMYPNEYLWMIHGTRKFKEGEEYLCMVKDILNRPKVPKYDFKWDVLLNGQKECDLMHGYHRELNDYQMINGKKMIIFPIKEWSDDDIWNYIKANKLEYNSLRYDNNNDKFNEDCIPACNNCLDYRCKEKEVFCPKISNMIPNISKSEEDCKKLLNIQLNLRR